SSKSECAYFSDAPDPENSGGLTRSVVPKRIADPRCYRGGSSQAQHMVLMTPTHSKDEAADQNTRANGIGHRSASSASMTRQPASATTGAGRAASSPFMSLSSLRLS